MKASELIAQLQALVAEHGDLDLYGPGLGYWGSKDQPPRLWWLKKPKPTAKRPNPDPRAWGPYEPAELKDKPIIII